MTDTTSHTRSVENFRTRTDVELPASLAGVVTRVKPAGLRETVRRVFADLAHLLERLRTVEETLSPKGPFDGPLSDLKQVQTAAEELYDFIKLRVEELERGGAGGALYDVLDGTTYAFRHELRRVYGDELRGLETLRSPALVSAQISHAVLLLRNCFQQATITLAQVFEPSLDGRAIFADADARLEQSLALAKELWVLVCRAREAARERERDTVIAFVEGLKRFRRGSMHYLMYRDWHAFEGYSRRVLAARGVEELTPVLEEFSVYLQNLLAQVRKRAVLADRPEAGLGAE